jgi:DNA adenine methylase
MRSPVVWFGGKGNMVRKILPLFPEHHTYVEPFGGGASLLFAKRPSSVEVYNDLNSGLVQFFRVIRDEEKFAKFHRLVSLTPYAREEYNYCRENWESQEDDVMRAYMWYVVARWSFSGKFGESFGTSVTHSVNGMVSSCARWLSTIELLPQIHTRITRVQIERQDFRTILDRYDTPGTLFYCDPPYVQETRMAHRYKHEMTEGDHRDFVNLLLGLQGMAIVSGYAHPIYSPLDNAGWARRDFETACSAAARTRATGILGKGAALEKQKRTETVWCSPNCGARQLELL